jgi:hypothetical protein
MNGSQESLMSEDALIARVIILTEKKRCIRCGDEKEITEFYRHKAHKSGRRNTCRVCDYEKNKDLIQEQSRKWRINHPEEHKAHMEKYRAENRDKISAYKQQYRQDHKNEIHDHYRKWYVVAYKNNPESFLDRTRKHIQRDVNKHREWCRLYQNKNYDSDKACARAKQYRENNIEKARERGRVSNQKRRVSAKGKIDHRMSSGIRQSLVKGKGGKGWEELVGYTAEDLKKHLQGLFNDGMDWDLFCQGKIHIDHVRPLVSFNFESPSDPDFRLCWGMGNLQPLWAKDNMTKRDKWQQGN